MFSLSATGMLIRADGEINGVKYRAVLEDYLLKAVSRCTGAAIRLFYKVLTQKD